MLILLATPLLLQTQGTPLSAEEKYKRRVTPVVEVIEAASPAVVFIQTELWQDFQDPFGRIFSMKTGAGAGSGVVIMKEGFITPNNHVVQGAKNIKVSFAKTYAQNENETHGTSAVRPKTLAQ